LGLPVDKHKKLLYNKTGGEKMTIFKFVIGVIGFFVGFVLMNAGANYLYFPIVRERNKILKGRNKNIKGALLFFGGGGLLYFSLLLVLKVVG